MLLKRFLSYDATYVKRLQSARDTTIFMSVYVDVQFLPVQVGLLKRSYDATYVGRSY
jgi:hypothetical protein